MASSSSTVIWEAVTVRYHKSEVIFRDVEIM